MGGVFAAQTEPGRYPVGTDLPQPNEADAGDRPAADLLRPQRSGQQLRNDPGIDAVVHQEAPFDDAGKAWLHHAGPRCPSAPRLRRRETASSGQTALKKRPTQSANLSSTSEYKIRLASRRSRISPAPFSTPRCLEI